MEVGNKKLPPWNTASAREMVTPAILAFSRTGDKERLGCEGMRMSRSLPDEAIASAAAIAGSAGPLAIAMTGPERCLA